MQTRKASIKESGEELPPADWERFDAAVADLKGERQSESSAEETEEQPQNSESKRRAPA